MLRQRHYYFSFYSKTDCCKSHLRVRAKKKRMVALMQNFVRQIRDDIDLLVHNKRINTILTSTEKISGLDQKQIVFSNVDLLNFFCSYCFLSFRHVRDSYCLFDLWLEQRFTL